MSSTEREEGLFLFSDVALGGPLAELEIVYQRRLETARTLGEESSVESLRAAYEVARCSLEAALAAPETESASETPPSYPRGGSS